MDRDAIINLEISKYKNEFDARKLEKEYNKEMKRRLRVKKREFRKNKRYLLKRCIKFNKKDSFQMRRKYIGLKHFIVNVPEEEHIEFIENEYRKYIDYIFKERSDKIAFLQKEKEWLENEMSGIKGKDTNISITYWLGIIISMAVSIILQIFNKEVFSVLLLVIFIVVGFKEIRKSTKRDSFKNKSLHAVNNILNDISPELTLDNISEQIKIINNKVNQVSLKVSNKKGILDKIRGILV